MAIGVEVDTLQGILGGSMWFHLDLDNDVLYLRARATLGESVFGEETPEGFTALRSNSGALAGMTVVNYWQRFGNGDVGSASIQAIKDQVAAWSASHIPAA